MAARSMSQAPSSISSSRSSSTSSSASRPAMAAGQRRRAARDPTFFRIKGHRLQNQRQVFKNGGKMANMCQKVQQSATPSTKHTCTSQKRKTKTAPDRWRFWSKHNDGLVMQIGKQKTMAASAARDISECGWGEGLCCLRIPQPLKVQVFVRGGQHIAVVNGEEPDAAGTVWSWANEEDMQL